MKKCVINYLFYFIFLRILFQHFLLFLLSGSHPSTPLGPLSKDIFPYILNL